MKKIFISTIVAVFLLMAGTVMAMGRHPGVDVTVSIPVLPHLVVMEEEPYYLLLSIQRQLVVLIPVKEGSLERLAKKPLCQRGQIQERTLEI